MIRFFKNLWFFFVADFGKIHKLHSDFYRLKVDVVELELFRRKLSEERVTNQELRRLNRVLQSKKDREEIFEDKASISVKVNRWANEVNVDQHTPRELDLIQKSLTKVYDRLPQLPKKQIVMDKTSPTVVKRVGLSTTMK